MPTIPVWYLKFRATTGAAFLYPNPRLVIPYSLALQKHMVFWEQRLWFVFEENTLHSTIMPTVQKT